MLRSTPAANLLTPDGPTGFPGDTWARQTITLRSLGPRVWQEAAYSAPSGNPREVKGANHDNVLSKMYKAPTTVEISVTYFGGGPIERFQTTVTRVPTDWSTGQPNTQADFYRVLADPGGVRRGEPHHADRLRADHLQLTFSAAGPAAVRRPW